MMLSSSNLGFLIRNHLFPRRSITLSYLSRSIEDSGKCAVSQYRIFRLFLTIYLRRLIPLKNDAKHEQYSR